MKRHSRIIKLKIVFFAIVGCIATGCEHYYQLYIVNKSGSDKLVSVVMDRPTEVDSLDFFPDGRKPSRRNYKRSRVKRVVDKWANSDYSFIIQKDEITLLQPVTIGTPVRGIITDSDTTVFTWPDGRFNNRFVRKWGDKFIFTIDK